MLDDRQNKRILLEDGTSLVGVDTLTKLILKQEEIPASIKVLGCSDTELYKLFYDTDVSFDDSTIPTLAIPDHMGDETTSEKLFDIIRSSPRYTGSEEQTNRLIRELEFFEKTSNIRFLLEVHALIKKFESSGIVWGVGRGSACASLVLFIMGVHDVDPILYDIRFSELTKDMDDDS